MSSILALDLGEKRIGVARASHEARLAQPLTTLSNDSSLADNLIDIAKQYDVSVLVIGLPRGLKGQTTAQTEKIREMAQALSEQLGLKVHWQDETMSSHQAEAELRARGVRYNKEAVDALAATLILEDFLRDHPQH